eukprot:CAMPEP_0116876242 /NCGR_PEP_ID=MMETSP0463-20121206/8234_1 /TAXON_ID=181622 /ORGANISM="Strombidinopsis sp, Strain SopsisLIS2011" /LENGTH=53 /DNA_ID=CAMNT_0004522751 /DNA_START=234 /DNA_END=395 /DNA_ORIENTATION=+
MKTVRRATQDDADDVVDIIEEQVEEVTLFLNVGGIQFDALSGTAGWLGTVYGT